MLADWSVLSDDLQVTLSREAMRSASEIIAEQAEALACEMQAGRLTDRGGPEALRLLAALIRVAAQDQLIPAGHC